MNQPSNPTISRRDFHKRAGQIAAATALSAMVVPHVHAAEDNTINLALIGTGGRGTGAVVGAAASSNARNVSFMHKSYSFCRFWHKWAQPCMNIPPWRDRV